MSAGKFRIRTMRSDEIALAADWAETEGWNPGLSDASCFACVDPEGFFIGEFEGEPAATLSVVNYDERFAFLGFYIVRPDLRGRGFGLRLWNAGMEHAGGRTVGLDGVVAQQDNYRKSGFEFAYNNVRYGGIPSGLDAAMLTVPLANVPFELVAKEDAAVFPADRPGFLRAWTGAKGHIGRAVFDSGQLAAWGVIRPCRRGRKIGPLVAHSRAAAKAVFAALAQSGQGEVFLDVPQPNRAAVELAEAHGLAPVFETARMYTGPVRPVDLQRVFGVTTFELG
jgi:GNAT superfamily N-acetyltransferase